MRIAKLIRYLPIAAVFWGSACGSATGGGGSGGTIGSGGLLGAGGISETGGTVGTGGMGGKPGTGGTGGTGGKPGTGGTGGTGGKPGTGGSAAKGGSSGTSAAGGATTCTNPVFVTSDPNGGWSDGGYYVHNNMWNSSAGLGPETLSACSYHSWYVASTQTNSAGAVKTYPNVHVDYDDVPISSF